MVFMWHHDIMPILKVIILVTTMLVSSLHTMVLENTTKCPIAFHLICIIILNYNWVTRILAHTLRWNLKSCYKVLKSKITTCFVVFLNTTLYKEETKEWTSICAYKCVPHHANPLLRILFCCTQRDWVRSKLYVVQKEWRNRLYLIIFLIFAYFILKKIQARVIFILALSFGLVHTLAAENNILKLNNLLLMCFQICTNITLKCEDFQTCC